MVTRLRILCLHGFTSNGSVHAHQLRRITSQLPEYDFLFPDAPHIVDIASQMDMTKPANQAWNEIVLSTPSIDSRPPSGHRAWWYAKESNDGMGGSFAGLEESLEFLGGYLKENGGSVHAIWGFSQGAGLTGMLTALLQDCHGNNPLRKIIETSAGSGFGSGSRMNLAPPLASVLFSGFRARFQQYDSIYEPGIAVPTMHVLGEQDPLVGSERSEALIRICKEKEILRHAGGHDIPKKEEDVRRILDFTRKWVRSGKGGENSVQACM